MGRLIGVFGGTFDPPHLGHLLLAECAVEELGLELVLWVLTPRSPLKPDGTPTAVEVRARLVEAAIAGASRFRLSTVDIDRRPPYYAVDTVERLLEADPEADLVYLFGSDTLADLRRWRDPARLVGLCAGLGLMERPGSTPNLEDLEQAVPGLSLKLRRFKAPLVEVSARGIRERVASGKSIRYLVPDAVRQLILEEGLYRDEAAA